MYGWENHENEAIMKQPFSNEYLFGNPLWHSVPVDSTSERSYPLVEIKGRLSKEDQVYIKELKEIWNDSHNRSAISTCYESEDESSSNISYNENQISTHKSDFDNNLSNLPIKQKGNNNVLTVSLSQFIPAAEIKQNKINEIASILLNDKQGYLHILKLAEMIINSLDN